MGNLTILIVEDVDINRAILVNIFQNDYDVLQAENGRVALNLLESGIRVDLILLDLMMPVMGGIELMRIIKEDWRLSKIPIIVNTQKGESEIEAEAFELGADDFVTKPYNPKTLQRRVKNLIEKYILERRQMQNLLQKTADQLETLTDTVPGGIAIFERRQEGEYDCTYYNEGLCELLGYNRAEMPPVSLEYHGDIIFQEDQPKLIETMEKAIKENRKVRVTLRMRKKYNEVIWVAITGRMLKYDAKNPSFHAVFIDLTDEKKNEMEARKTVRELQYRIEHDVLTGIYNRETFYERTREFISRDPQKQYIVAVWNIDRFKVVNELFGSEKGNEVLKNFAQYLKVWLEGAGTYGRLEADHFATCSTMELFEKQKQEYMELVERGIQGDIIEYPVLMHVGLYVVDEQNLTIDIMCDRANLALQSVKSNAMERYAYYSYRMSTLLFDEQNMVSEMNTALNERQFFIQLQPVMDVVTGRVISAEALVRWKHPARGLISPGYFIPLFEKNGFITKLDMYVWEEVCKVLAENKQRGIVNVPISINVSRINFYRQNLLEQMLELLERYNLSPELVKLEITESAYTDNPDQLLSVMDHFQRKGFKILMDDFGSGYSSLNMLKNVPVDILKIDVKFMDNLEKSRRASDIIRSIIEMAKLLHMQTVAEGVETKSQFELLKSMGCDTVQGYYFSKPLPVSDFGRYVEDNHAEHPEDTEKDTAYILVVDDVEVIRASIMCALEAEYTILEARDGLEAYGLLEKYGDKIQLVLTDIMMPRMDGFTLMEAMSENAKMKHIPIIVLTADERAEQALKALAKGAVDVIAKPFEPDILMTRVHNVISIVESKNLESEVQVLREDNLHKQNVKKVIESGAHAVCRMKLLDHCSRYHLLYANKKYYDFHNLQAKEKSTEYAMNTLWQNLCGVNATRLETNLRNAVEQKRKIVQNIIYCVMKNGEKKKILSTGSLNYIEDEVCMELLEVEMQVQDMEHQEKREHQEKQEPAAERDGSYREILRRNAYLIAEVDLTENQFLTFQCEDMNSQGIRETTFYDEMLKELVEERVCQDEKGYVQGMLSRQQLLKWFKDGEVESKVDFQLETGNDGNYQWYSSIMYFTQKEGHVTAIWQIRNVHSEKKRLTHMSSMSEYDALTGLYNRTAFKKRMEEAYEDYESSRHLSAFLMVDIDNFKQINDSFGHDFGDNIINTIAAQIRTTFRREDSMGRLGGDKFAVFIPRMAQKSLAEKKAQELCEKLRITFDNCGKDVSISCSIGIAFSPESGCNFEELCRCADEAQYQAKKAGKNNYVLY